jgi:hypothetical protein
MRSIIIISVWLLGLMFFSMSLLALLNKYTFDEFINQSYHSKLEAMSENLRNIYLQSFALGLPMHDLQAGRETLREMIAVDKDLHSVVLYERLGDGFKVFAGTSKVGEALPSNLAVAIRREPNAKSWRIKSYGTEGVLLSIESSFNEVEGYVYLDGDGTEERELINQNDDLIIRYYSVVFLVAALLLIPGTLWGIWSVLNASKNWEKFALDFDQAQNGNDYPVPELPAIQGDTLSYILKEPFQKLLDLKAQSELSV